MTHIRILYYAFFIPYNIEQIVQDLQLSLLPNLSEEKKINMLGQLHSNWPISVEGK